MIAYYRYFSWSATSRGVTITQRQTRQCKPTSQKGLKDEHWVLEEKYQLHTWTGHCPCGSSFHYWSVVTSGIYITMVCPAASEGTADTRMLCWRAEPGSEGRCVSVASPACGSHLLQQDAARREQPSSTFPCRPAWPDTQIPVLQADRHCLPQATQTACGWWSPYFRPDIPICPPKLATCNGHRGITSLHLQQS